jgi:uncharacterized membrane protein HdeD (DUF308 family)
MKKFFRHIRFDVLLSAILCIAFGIVLILYPTEVTAIICRIFAAILIIMGAGYIFSYFANEKKNTLRIAGGLVFLLVGVWVLIRPNSVLMLIPIVIGVILLIHALEDFRLALDTKNQNYSGWWIIFLMALISAALGVVCICDSFGVLEISLILIGISLIYDGISDIWIVISATRSFRRYEKEAGVPADIAKAEPDIIDDIEPEDLEIIVPSSKEEITEE